MKNRYLIVVWGDIEISLQGPYKSERTRLAAARKHRREDPGMHDGIFWLDMDCNLTIGDFTGLDLG